MEEKVKKYLLRIYMAFLMASLSFFMLESRDNVATTIGYIIFFASAAVVVFNLRYIVDEIK